MNRKYLCNINEDESLHLQDNNQFVVHTLDINAPQEWFDVVVLKQEGYDKMKKQIAELQDQLEGQVGYREELEKQIDLVNAKNTELKKAIDFSIEAQRAIRDEMGRYQDKLHRRNLQIANLKKKIDKLTYETAELEQ